MGPVMPAYDAYQPANAAVGLAQQVHDAFNQLKGIGALSLPAEPTDEQLLQLPLGAVQLDERLLDLPGRRQELAMAIAVRLFADEPDPFSALVRYDDARKAIAHYVRLSRRHAQVTRAKGREQHSVHAHIRQQGTWDPARQPVAYTGPSSLPMPVEIATAESLQPFFAHVRNNGSHNIATLDASLPAQQTMEDHYDVPALEFPRGVVYEDRRLDLCKMVVGPTHIGELMESLRTNEFIRHFLLGNNIIGPKGARAIAAFLGEFPDRIDTWYLAGNAIHGPAFSELVDALIQSHAVTNIWLKRNPLGSMGNDPVDDIYRLITQTPNLRTLDLDQTELGDIGVGALFDRFVERGGPRKLENLYLNGNGIHRIAAAAISHYLEDENCTIRSLYMSNNPIGDDGIASLSLGLSRNRTLKRLCIQSVGMGDRGLAYLSDALSKHPALSIIDVGTSYATLDLGQPYNVFSNDSVPHIAELIRSSSSIEYLDLGTTTMDTASLNKLLAAAAESLSLLFYNATSSVKHLPHRDTDLETIHLRQVLKKRLTTNVQAKHGGDMTYDRWHRDERRWLVSDGTDVRKIDSVYRNRDAGMARRGQKRLDKWWSEGNEGVLREAMGVAVGPVCTSKRRPKGFWAGEDGVVDDSAVNDEGAKGAAAEKTIVSQEPIRDVWTQAERRIRMSID